MSYRNPRFSYVHALRDIGAPGWDAAISTVPLSTTPKERLWDDQSRRNVKYPADVGTRQGFIRRGTVIGDTRKLDRIIIPKGHNFKTGTSVIALFDPEGDATPQAKKAFSDGLTLDGFVPSRGLVDFEFQSPHDDAAMALSQAEGFGTDPFELGEIWWTRTEQATRGIAQSWEDVTVPNVRQSVSESGHVFFVEHGDPLRTFTIEQHNLKSGDPDLTMYDELLRYTRGIHPFWFEHGDSGDASVEVQKTDGWTNFFTAGTQTNTATTITTTSTAIGALDITLSSASLLAGVPTDLRDYLLRYDLSYSDQAFLVGAADHQFFLDPPVSPANRYNYYNVAGGLKNVPAGDVSRIEIDLSDPSGVNVLASGASLADNPTTLRWRFNASAIGQSFTLSNVRLVKKSKQPVLVQIIPGSVTRTQDSSVPAATKPSFTISFGMIEVSS